MLHTEVNKWQLWWWRREHFGHRYKFSSLLSDWMGDVVAECEDGAARLILTDTRVWKLKLNLQSQSSDEWQQSSGFLASDWIGSEAAICSRARQVVCTCVCTFAGICTISGTSCECFKELNTCPTSFKWHLKKKSSAGEETEQNTLKSPSCYNDTLNSTVTARSENTCQEPAVFHNCCLSGKIGSDATNLSISLPRL